VAARKKPRINKRKSLVRTEFYVRNRIAKNLWDKGYLPYCKNGKKSFQEKRRGIGINIFSVRKCILLLGDISSKCFNSEGPRYLLHCIKRTAAGLYAVFRPSDVYGNLLGDDVSI
jgi:hypothetical protein